MTSENWDAPSLADRIRNPRLGAEWMARCRAWADANPELAAAWDEANAEEDERRRVNREKRARIATIRASGMGERIADAWAWGLDETPATCAVRHFLEFPRSFLLLLGSAGTGKTLAASIAVAERSGLFVRALELARLSMFEANDRARLERAQRARLLVLDDLGAEMLHDGWRPMLDELMDIRYADRLPTIITTNLDQAAFKARYGERIVDRIRHDGYVEKCGDKTRRTPKGLTP